MEDLKDELTALQTELTRLRSLEQIRSMIYQGARALDRLDRELLQAQFWPDAEIDYGNLYRGGIDGFLELAMRFQGSMRDTQHMIGNVNIDLQGEFASAESYVHAQHVLLEEGNWVQLIVGGRYLDRFSRRNGLWRLSFRTEVLDWGRHIPIPEHWFDSNMQLPKGRRDRNDLSYTFLKR